MLPFHQSFAQSSKKIRIDTLANRIEALYDFYRCEDSRSFFDQDSAMVGFTSYSFRYTDKAGRNLVWADEWNQTPADTSIVVYYFRNNQLIKVDARRRVKGDLFIQELYFDKGKLVYASPAEKPLIDPDQYVKKAARLSKNRCKDPEPNYIIESLHR